MPLASASAPPRMIGDTIIWVMIFGDMSNFVAGFCYYGWLRQGNLVLFQQSQQSLDLTIGGINSLIMLVSSWFMVLAIHAARKAEHRKAAKLILATLLCGAIFSALKASEFIAKADLGIHYLSNDFFTLYYTLTGFHFTHVVVGVIVLLWFAWQLRREPPSDRQLGYLETAGIYWHMVDLLWIVIFTLVYLLP